MTALDPPLVDIARRYLLLCQSRRFDVARRLLADGAVMVFPGGRRFHTLEQMATHAAGRYRRLTKHVEACSVGHRVADAASCVTVIGTLEGEDIDGAPFSGVRFCDVFIFDGGLIREHRVFNDLAEMGTLRRWRAHASGSGMIVHTDPNSRSSYVPAALAGEGDASRLNSDRSA